MIEALPLDRGVGPSPVFVGGATTARDRLDRFLRERLVAYDTDRDRPERDGQSGLAPYLHYGQIGPIGVAIAVRSAPLAWTSDRLNPAAIAFLDELIVQRELAINFALRNPAYDRYEGLPAWGRTTLAEHATDPRPVVYPRDQLDAGETVDALWNAAQVQMAAEGWMPNRLRMYWAKQLLRWTPTPEDAYEATMTMNDRYFLCGRDAAGYANVAWAIGGRHDRPFPPNKPIFGLVRPMGLSGMRKRFDVDAYIASVAARLGAIPGFDGEPALQAGLPALFETTGSSDTVG